jgi:glycosyltransferase involved in cell wall biosynthesis
VTTLLAINNYHYYRGGAETIFLRENELFADLGWSVIPFCMKHPQNIPTPWSVNFVDEIELGSGYSLAEKLRRVPKVIYSFEARRRLDLLLTRERPDICHAHNIYHHISPSILGLLKSRGIPTVLTLHDLKIACPAYNMLAHDGICERCRGNREYNVLLHRCIKGSTTLSTVVLLEAVLHRVIGSYRNNVDMFAVPSRFYIEKFCEWGWPRSKFRYIPNFVDVAKFIPRYSPGREFVFVGRISREKGIATLIHAIAAAGCALKIVGTGPESAAMRELATTLGADVEFLGYLGGSALHDAVRHARALVLPSECYENAPMSVLEAYALGKPVIGARIGGIPELIRENETGLGFASGDVQSLVAALRDMEARSFGEIEAMGRRGRLWVETDFAAPKYRDRLLALYRELGAEIALPASAAAPSAGEI